MEERQPLLSSNQLRETDIDLHTLSETAHQLTEAELCRQLMVNKERGLSSQEAQNRIAQFGPNRLAPPARRPLALQFVIQMFSGFCPLLWVASVLCFVSWKPLGEPNPDPQNLTLAIVLLVVIVLQSLFNLYQDFSSRRVMEAISEMIPVTSTVFRDGSWAQVDAGGLVIGDVVRLEAGMRMPADIRVVQAASLKIDSSSLTGESAPITVTTEVAGRDVSVNDATNIGLFGSTISQGSGRGIVFATGESTKLGHSAALAAKTPARPTPVQSDVNQFVLIIVALAVVTGLFTYLVWKFWLDVKHPEYLNTPGMIIDLIGLIVAYVPEGMPLAVTLTLRNVAQRMHKKNLLVKQLTSVETLGCTTAILSDKTGTITENRMTVQHLAVGGKTVLEVARVRLNEAIVYLIHCACLCNGSENTTVGSPTDCAVLRLNERLVEQQRQEQTQLQPGSPQLLQSWDRVRRQHLQVHLVPFNSSNKWMASVHRDASSSGSGGSELTLLMKGAPERVLPLCTTRLVGPNLQGREDQFDHKEVTGVVQHLANHGERVIAVAMRKLGAGERPENAEHMLEGLCFLGLLSMEDPPREGVKEAVNVCRQAGIRVAMITGDHIDTAVSISRQINLISGEEDAMVHRVQDLPRHEGTGITHDHYHQLQQQPGSHGSRPSPSASALAPKAGESVKGKLVGRSELTSPTFFSNVGRNGRGNINDADESADQGTVKAVALTGADVDHALKTEADWDWVLKHEELVFARTSPENKMTIVKEFQKRDHIVAVTGDGVNDSGALKCADIGIAMGAGTDIAKEAAGMVLLDNSFASIVTGVEQGRLVFDNIKKVVLYLLPAGSWSEMLPVIAAVFLGMPQPLSSFQMIIICMLTDLFPSLAMVYESAEADTMHRPPRNVKLERMVNTRLLAHAYLNIGMVESFAAFLIFFHYMSSYANISPGDMLLVFDQWGDGYLGYSADELNEYLLRGQTVFFVALVITQFGNALAVRTRRVTALWPWHEPNYMLFVGMGCSLVVAIFVVYVPAMNQNINTRPIPAEYWFLPLCSALIIPMLDELRKLAVRKGVPVFRKLYW